MRILRPVGEAVASGQTGRSRARSPLLSPMAPSSPAVRCAQRSLANGLKAAARGKAAARTAKATRIRNSFLLRFEDASIGLIARNRVVGTECSYPTRSFNDRSNYGLSASMGRSGIQGCDASVWTLRRGHSPRLRMARSLDHLACGRSGALSFDQINALDISHPAVQSLFRHPPD
jgi:hypothetical protein